MMVDGGHERLLELVSSYLEGVADEPETRELERRLREDPEARVLMGRLLDQHVALQWLHTAQSPEGERPLALEGVVESAVGTTMLSLSASRTRQAGARPGVDLETDGAAAGDVEDVEAAEAMEAGEAGEAGEANEVPLGLVSEAAPKGRPAVSPPAGGPRAERGPTSPRRARLVRRRRRAAIRYVLSPLAAAAAFLLIIRYFGPWQIGTSRQATTATVVDVRGGGELIHGGRGVPLERDMAVEPGSVVQTGAGTRVELLYPDGTMVELGGLTDVTFLAGGEAKRLGLERGELTVEAALQPEGAPMVVATPHAEATVLGTRFVLKADAAASRLEVIEGRVRFTHGLDGRSVVVARGGHARATEESLKATCTFAPVDDAYIENSRPHNNRHLKVEIVQRERVSYLKFDVQGLRDGAVVSAKLRLKVKNDPGRGTLRFYAGDRIDWTEDDLSVSNAPAARIEVGTFTGRMHRGQVVEADVTPLVRGDGVLSVVIRLEGPDDVWFSSREGETPPELVVTVE